MAARAIGQASCTEGRELSAHPVNASGGQFATSKALVRRSRRLRPLSAPLPHVRDVQIAAAPQGASTTMSLPPLLYETHVHTPLCGHASGTPSDYATAAGRRGLAGIVFTCHNPMPHGYSAVYRMTENQFTDYLEWVAATRDEHLGAVDVRLGLECDYLPEFEPWLSSQIAGAPLDYVLGSVHAQYPEYRARFGTPDDPYFYRRYFEHLSLAAESGLFDCLAHPDLVKTVAPEHWSFEACRPWVEESLDRVAAAGVALEYNTSGLNKAPFEAYPGTDLLREIVVRDIPVVVGSDAHDPTRVGEGFEAALSTLSRLGCSRVSYFLGRSRIEVGLEAATASLRTMI
jgi:histidinol-phosphatase (PHP family)